MKPRHPNVVESFRFTPHVLGGYRSLLGHGNVAAAGSDDREAGAGRVVLPLCSDDPGLFVEYGVLQVVFDNSVLVGRSPRKEDVVLRSCEGRGDGLDLGIALSGAVDDLREPFPEGPVGVEFYLPEVPEGHCPYLPHQLMFVEISVLHPADEGKKALFIHCPLRPFVPVGFSNAPSPARYGSIYFRTLGFTPEKRGDCRGTRNERRCARSWR